MESILSSRFFSEYWILTRTDYAEMFFVAG